MMELWWSRSQRLHWELGELTRCGFRYEDPGDLENPGVLTLRVYVQIQGREEPLDVAFPELYPYFRCEVIARGLELPYHQNPFSGSLCLLGRSTDSWDVSNSVARLLANQLPLLLKAARPLSAADAQRLEEHQAEPFSDYYPYSVGDQILIDGEWLIPSDCEVGQLEVGYTRPTKPGEPFRGAVIRIEQRNGAHWTAPSFLLDRFGGDVLRGDFVQLREPLRIGEPDAFQRQVRASRPSRWEGGAVKNSVVGAVFPEESTWRGGNASGQGWVFVVGTKARHALREEYRFVRAVRAGARDMVARAPELNVIRRHSVAVVGLGCLGAPSAVEFARAGVQELRLLDRDYVDPGAGLRWPLGLVAAGRPKVEALGQFIREHYPLSKVSGYVHALGGCAPDTEVLRTIFDGATLLYDATAETGISYLLAEWSRRAGIPYVGVTGTRGGWGGKVVRLRSDGSTGCWHCLRTREGSSIPPPPEDTTAEFQPAGCGDPTFTAAGFDMTTIALCGVRIAVSTMLEGEGGYPPTSDDVLVLSLRDSAGRLLGVKSEGFRLEPVPGCPVCGQTRASG